jgi:hypothetical protein
MITKPFTLIASAQQNTVSTTTGTAVVLDRGGEQLIVVANVSAVGGGAGAGDLLKMMVDTSFDGGATWINIGRADLAGNAAAKKQIMVFNVGQAAGTQPIDATSDLGAAGVREIGFGDQIRARGITTGASADFTYSITGYDRA